MSEQEKEDIKEIKRSLTRIEMAVLGDEEAGTTGLVKRMKTLEDYKEADQKFKHKVAGGIAVGTPVLVVAWSWIKTHVFGL
jgi:hypothetical protein